MSANTIKLLVVDDEPPARRRIRSFDLARHGFEIVGEADNGLKALQMIERLQPHIVVADIGMPVMSGLDMLKRLQADAGPASPKVVLLTCYEDFDKAQTALKHGAADYMTKLLLNEDEFIEAMNKVAAAIRKENDLNSHRIRRTLQETMLFHTADMNKFADRLAELQVKCVHYRLALLACGSMHAAAAERCIGELEQTRGPFRSLPVRISPTMWSVLYLSDGSDPAEEFHAWSGDNFARAEEGLRRAIRPGCLLTAIGAVQRELGQFPQAWEQCRRLLDEAFYVDKRPSSRAERCEDAYPEDRLLPFLDELKAAIAERNTGGVERLLNEWLHEVGRDARPPADLAKRMAYQLADCIPLHCVVPDAEGRMRQLRQLLRERLDTACRMPEIGAMLREAFGRLGDGPNRPLRTEVSEAIRYIREHYQSNIQLTDVAKFVNLSPSWLSAVFRNETGQTLFDYLQAYRLQLAKTMLLTTDLKIYEIAARVGIPNARYFSRLFSEAFDRNPQEFRACRRD